jgi:acyl carrier protein
MRGSLDNEFKLSIKKLILKTCRVDVPPESLSDDAPLLGPGSILGLDSLDTLELAVVLKKQYGLQINDSKEAVRIIKSVNFLADVIHPV